MAWNHIGTKDLADLNILHLARDRLEPSRIYALTSTDLYVSDSAGDRWFNVTTTGGRPRPPGSSRNADPFAFAQLLPPGGGRVALWSFRSSGLHYSSDGGRTSRQFYPFLDGAKNDDNDVVSIATDDATGRVYVSTSALDVLGARVFRSDKPWTTAGPPQDLQWEPIGSTLPPYPETLLLAWGGKANRLIAAATSGSTSVYTSVDAGDNWTKTAALSNFATWDARPLLVPEPDRILVGTVVGFESLNFGATWSGVFMPYTHPDVRALAFQDFGPSKYVWQGTDGTMDADRYSALIRWNYESGVPLSNALTIPASGAQRIRTWQTYYALAAGRTLHVGSLDNNAHCTSDDGATWTPARGGNGCFDALAMSIAPSNSHRAYALTCDPNSILRTENAASACASVSWSTIPSPNTWFVSSLRWSRHLITVDPRNADHIAVARTLDVLISSDAGASVVARTLPEPDARPLSVLFDSTGALWVGTFARGVYRSVDDGITFTSLGEFPSPPPQVFALAWSPIGGNEGTIFAGTSDGLFIRGPGGAFARVLGGGGYAVSEVTVDPTSPFRIYAGFGHRSRAPHRGGVAHSNDAGITWTSISSGTEIHAVPITSIQVTPDDAGVVFVASFGRGVWMYK